MLPVAMTASSRLAGVETRIYSVRGLAVMFDSDLADLYEVTPSALMQAVRRNLGRFPEDFMFQLSNQELNALKSQIVISKPRSRRGGRRSNPYAFTEQGVAMLSSVVRNETAVRLNIEIVRAFVRLRRAALVSQEVMRLVEDLSDRVDSHDGAIGNLVEAIRQLVEAPQPELARPIGFTADLERRK